MIQKYDNIKAVSKADIQLYSHIKHYRQLLKLTQTELAYRANIQGNVSNMTRIETASNVKLTTVKKFLDALNEISEERSINGNSLNLSLSDLISMNEEPRIKDFDVLVPEDDSLSNHSINIKKYRTMYNLSLKDLASKTGISLTYISDIEHNRKFPNTVNLYIILDVFQQISAAAGDDEQITLDDLVSFE